MSFPIRFDLRADDRASDNLRAVNEILRQGTQASVDAKLKFREMTDNLHLQNRALGALRTQFRVAHADAMLFGRALSSIGSIGNTLLNIVTGISTAMIRVTNAKREAAKVSEDVREAERKEQEMLKQHGGISEEYLKAKSERIKLEHEHKAALDELAHAEFMNTVAIGGTVQSLVGLGSQIIIAYSSVALLKGGFAGLTLAAAGAATPWLAAALAIGAVGASVLEAIPKAISFREEMGRWPTTAEDARLMIKSLADAIPLLGPPLAEMTAGFIEIAARIGEWWENTSKGFEDWRTSVEKTVNELGANVTKSIFEWLTSAGGVIGSWGNSVVDWFFNLPKRIGEAMAGLASILAGVFKSAFNAVISVINRAIGGLNSISVSIPTWVPGIGGASFGINLPTIPLLAQGGVITKPTLALLGEAGPEAVVPLGGSRSAFSPQINIYVQGSIVTEREITDMVSRRLFEEYSRLTR